MSENAPRLSQELANLPHEDRAALAHFPIDTLTEPVDLDADEAWDEELQRREAEILSGKAIGQPASEVFAELREKQS